MFTLVGHLSKVASVTAFYHQNKKNLDLLQNLQMAAFWSCLTFKSEKKVTLKW